MRLSIGACVAVGTALAAGGVWAQPDAATISESTVQVIAMDAGEVRRVGSGFVVTADGHVLTAANLVEGRGPFAVTPLSTGAELVARVAFLDEGADIAVLAVNGLDLPPFELAMDGFEAGRSVYSTGVWSDTGEPMLVAVADTAVVAALSEGAVGAHSELALRDRPVPVQLIGHNAMIPAAGYGGALLNDCGEVAAVNRASPGVSAARLRQGQAPEGVVHAVRATVAVEWLQSQEIDVSVSDTACADALAAAQTQARETAVQLEESQQQLEQATGEAEEAQAAVEQTQTELEQAQQALEQAAGAADEATARVGELEAQYEEAVRVGDEQAEAFGEELESARERQAQAQSAVDTMKEELAALQARLDEAARANLIRLAAAAGTAAVLLLGGFVVYRRRSHELALARDEASRAQREASAAIAAAHTVESGFADCVLAGETGAGTPVSIKIPGALLQGDGAVLGRSPANATFLIDDPTLSREHARLFGDDGALYLEDLGATNGSRINGRRVAPGEPVLLDDGYILELGEVNLRLALVS